jgi:uncharacterized protein YqjF (DUF2071 family)
MFSFLKNHPFAVEAFFESSLVLTFAVHKDKLQHLIPPCLSLDLYEEEYAFVAMALVNTKALRPKGFPAWLGQDFSLIGYRIFVRYTNSAGKKYRGLYILKSETDQPKMEWLGNLFTRYQYSTTDIKYSKTGLQTHITSVRSDFTLTVEQTAEEPAMPSGSPFADWTAARKFAGPLPFTFSYDTLRKDVLIVEGVRQHWKPVPVTVHHHDISFIKKLPLSKVVLANAFILSNIPYYWKKGRTEKWSI